MPVTILRQVMPQHPKLGRNVHLDSRSWAYALQPKATPVVSVRHEAHIGIMNQGQVGSCTGNASVYCAYRTPFYAPGAPAWPYAADEDGAVAWYRRNTQLDGYGGVYEPEDTGSDGLTASKVAVEAGIIPGYQMAGDLDSSLQALMDRPGITGLPWYRSMFDAPSSGLLTVDTSSGVAGGHEICVDEVVAADAPGNGTGKVLVGGPNSWGPDWGADGRWYLTADDWWQLRQDQGDVYFWTAKSQPAPVPAPEAVVTADDTDRQLWADTAAFRQARHGGRCGARSAVRFLESWAARKGLS